tara:strand:+ start:1976 stop:2212 length:237 start_codon:yes stop_codon:yes gene_type:complete
MPRRVRDLSDNELQILDTNGASRNKFVLRYNATTDEFEVVSTDDVLISSLTTPSPRDFVTTLESQLEDVQRTFQGGTF